MTRRDIALYKLASFSHRLQKKASTETPKFTAPKNPLTLKKDDQTFTNTMKWNMPALAALALAGGVGGGFFGGEEGRLKRRLLGALGLPAVYAAYLAAKNGNNGGLLQDYGINGVKMVDEPMKYINNTFWNGYPGIAEAYNSPAYNVSPKPTT